MPYYFCRLIPPRPTFAQDMNEAEQDAMKRHGAYLRELARRGKAILCGPVADPNGAWGLGLFDLESEDELRQVLASDPAVTSNVGLRYEHYPLLGAITHPALAKG